MSWILAGRPYDTSSIDSQFTDVEEELTVLDACIDCDDEALYDIVQNGVTSEHVNERDKSGRVSLYKYGSEALALIGPYFLSLLLSAVLRCFLWVSCTALNKIRSLYSQECKDPRRQYFCDS